MESSQVLGANLIQVASDQLLKSDNPKSLVFNVTIAETRFRIYLSSQALWDLIHPALSWQAQSSGPEPDVEIFALEGVGTIHSPWMLEDFLDGSRIKGLENGNVLGTFELESTTLNLYDSSTRKGLFWVQSANDVPDWEFGAPLRRIFEWALLERGFQVIHSAGVGKGLNGVLLSGSGGAGKSTTTAMCLGRDFKTTGDDYCAISVSGPHKVFGLYGLLKLVPGAVGTEDLQDLTWLKRRIDGKVHYKIEQKMVKFLEINAIVFPKVTDRPKQLSPIPPKDAFLRLLSSTLNQSTNPQVQLFEALGALSRSVPAFELEVGSDFDPLNRNLSALCAR
jgi:hypothetical protein